MKLYEITGALRLLESTIDDSLANGEPISPEVQQRLDALEGEREQKIGNICRLIKNTDAECEALENEIRKLRKRKEQVEGKAEWLRGYLTQNLTPGEKFKDSATVISWRPSRSVEVYERGLLPTEYLRVKTEPNLEDIGEAMRHEIDVPGCRWKEKLSLQIR